MGRAVKFIAAAILVAAYFVTGGTQTWLLKLAAVLALSGLADVLAARPRATAGNPGTAVEYSGGVEPRRILYGSVRVSGMNVIPAMTSGVSNEYLHQVLAIAGHQVTAISDAYADQTLIASANIGAVTGTNDDGLVSAGQYANFMWIRKFLGTSSQTVDFILNAAFASNWDSNHRGRGIAYIALRYKYDNGIYRNGKPEMTFQVDGKALYDPRLDTTPGAAPTNPSFLTTTHRDNPALQLVDYMIDNAVGLGELASRIDWPAVVTAANICDETPLIPPASPTTTQKRYTSNVVLEATSRFEENIQILAGAMLGSMIYQGGKWTMRAGAWSAAAFTLTESDLAGDMSLITDTPRRDKFNSVRGWFLDANQNYSQTEFTPITNSTYETADGERIYKEIQLAACTNGYECQRDAIILNRLGRRVRVLSGVFGMSAYGVKVGETGTMTIAELGWAAQAVRCQTWSFAGAGKIALTLREEASTDWTDPIVADYVVPGSNVPAAPAGFIPSNVNGFTANSVQDGILFSWLPPDVSAPGVTYSISEFTAATPFSSATLIVSGLTGTSRTVIKSDTTQRYYWIQAQLPGGTLSAVSPPATAGLAGKALAISVGFRTNPESSYLFKDGNGSSQTTAAASYTVIGGTPAFTYAWVRSSGDASTTVSNSAIQLPTFSRTGMALETSYDSVWTCTVTDSLAATCTHICSVQIYRTNFQ